MRESNPHRADNQPSAESPNEPIPPDSEPPVGSAEQAVNQPEQDLGEEARLREGLKWYQAARGQYDDVTTMSPARLQEKHSLVKRFLENYWTPSEEQKILLSQLYDTRLLVESRTEPTPIESARVTVAQEVYSDIYSEKFSLLEQQARARPTLFETNETMKQTRRELVSGEKICQGLRELGDKGQAASTSLLEAEFDLQISRRHHETNQQAFLEAQDRANQIDDWAKQTGLTNDEVAGCLERHAGSQRIELAHQYATDQVFSLYHLGHTVGRSLTPEQRLVYGLSHNEPIEQKVGDRLGDQLGDGAWGDEYAWVANPMRGEEDLFDLVDYDKPHYAAAHEISRLSRIMPGGEGRLSDYRDNESRYAVADRFRQSRDAIRSIIDDRSAARVGEVYDDFHQTRLNEQAQLAGQIPADLLKLFEAEG